MKMNVRPITPLANVNNYTNLTFDGKKKKNVNQNLNITRPSSHKLAVPLAAALTIAPLNVLDAKNNQYVDFSDNKNSTELVYGLNSVDAATENGVVIESRDFISPKFGNYKISLVSTDGNNKTFEKVIRSYYNNLINEIITHDIKQLAVYNFQVISDDGSKGSKVSCKDVIVDAGDENIPYTYNQDEIVNYVESLIDDPRNNNAVEKTIYNRSIRPDMYGYFQNVPNGDILKNAVPYKPDGKLIDTCPINDGDVQIGMLRFYSLGDDNTINLTTYQPNGYPELRIYCMYADNHIFEPYSDEPTSLQTGVLNLMDGNNKHYYIESPAIVYGMANLQKQNNDMLKSAFTGFSNNRHYAITPKGAISPFEPEE